MLATLAKLLMLPLAPAPGVGMAPMFIIVDATFWFWLAACAPAPNWLFREGGTLPVEKKWQSSLSSADLGVIEE